MATLRGALRSYAAAAKRAERLSQKRARETAKKFHEQQKQQALLDAQEAVKDWECYVHMIQSFHKECTSPIDWESIKNTPAPVEPVRLSTNEDWANYKLTNFRPSFWDKLIFNKLFSSISKKIQKLEQKCLQAKHLDDQIHDQNIKKYKQYLFDWEYSQRMVWGVENRDAEICQEIIEYFDPFGELSEIGSSVLLQHYPDWVDAYLHVHDTQVIPNYVLSLTKTGKLSNKAMNKTAYNELYQDHVCSALLRVAREVFSHLHIKYARVTALNKMVNPQTGHLEERAIVSALIPLETMQQINLDSIDPSDSFNNFIHNMEFKKTTGFSPVEIVNLPEHTQVNK